MLKKKKEYLDELAKICREKEFYEVSKKLLELWLKKILTGRTIDSYFSEKGIKKIAIYGMSQTGYLLYKHLEDTEISVEFVIDRSGKDCGLDVRVYLPDAVDLKLCEGVVDAIIVAPIYYFSEIYDMLNVSLNNQIPIIGLDEVLCEQ